MGASESDASGQWSVLQHITATSRVLCDGTDLYQKDIRKRNREIHIHTDIYVCKYELIYIYILYICNHLYMDRYWGLYIYINIV